MILIIFRNTSKTPSTSVCGISETREDLSIFALFYSRPQSRRNYSQKRVSRSSKSVIVGFPIENESKKYFFGNLKSFQKIKTRSIMSLLVNAAQACPGHVRGVWGHRGTVYTIETHQKLAGGAPKHENYQFI